MQKNPQSTSKLATKTQSVQKQYPCQSQYSTGIEKYSLTYPDSPYVPHFLQVGLFAILSASLQSLLFEVKSFDNFKYLKLLLTHCCQVFLGQPQSYLPAISCCVHFFIQSLLGQTFAVLHPDYLSIIYLINYGMTFYH